MRGFNYPLSPKVYKSYLHWAIWIVRASEMQSIANLLITRNRALKHFHDTSLLRGAPACPPSGRALETEQRYLKGSAASMAYLGPRRIHLGTLGPKYLLHKYRDRLGILNLERSERMDPWDCALGPLAYTPSSRDRQECVLCTGKGQKNAQDPVRALDMTPMNIP